MSTLENVKVNSSPEGMLSFKQFRKMYSDIKKLHNEISERKPINDEDAKYLKKYTGTTKGVPNSERLNKNLYSDNKMHPNDVHTNNH